MKVLKPTVLETKLPHHYKSKSRLSTHNSRDYCLRIKRNPWLNNLSKLHKENPYFLKIYIKKKKGRVFEKRIIDKGGVPKIIYREYTRDI